MHLNTLLFSFVWCQTWFNCTYGITHIDIFITSFIQTSYFIKLEDAFLVVKTMSEISKNDMSMTLGIIYDQPSRNESELHSNLRVDRHTWNIISTDIQKGRWVRYTQRQHVCSINNLFCIWPATHRVLSAKHPSYQYWKKLLRHTYFVHYSSTNIDFHQTPCQPGYQVEDLH